MNSLITAEYFKHATGREPQQDDLERSNCKLAGQIGHAQCGWNWKLNDMVACVGKELKDES